MYYVRFKNSFENIKHEEETETLNWEVYNLKEDIREGLTEMEVK